jgi:cysteine desulfurase
MAANNEIGSIQPVAALWEICRSRSIAFHTDAVQLFGKEGFESIHQFNADLVSVCAHKLYGPKGAGALFVRSPLHPDPILFGGSHENERRAGTENMAGIVGFVEALTRFVRPPVFCPDILTPLTSRLIKHPDLPDGVEFRGSPKKRLANTAAFTVAGCDSITLLAGLDLLGICASSGSACSTGSLEPSHVLLALGVEKRLASSLVRFSLGRTSTLEEVEAVADAFSDVIKRARCL